MALRTNGDAVKGIIDTELTAEQVAPFINTANLVVTRELGAEGLSAEILTEIELWLSAHLVAVRDPRVADKRTDDLSLSFEGRSRVGSVEAVGLQTTSYGKQVFLLDPTGKLSAAMNPKKRPWRFRAGSPDAS